MKSEHAYVGVRMTGLSTFRKHRVDTISRYFRSRLSDLMCCLRLFLTP